MNNVISMSAEFERQKNSRALLLTALISGLLFLLVWMISWTIPTPEVAPMAEAVEIFLPDEPVEDINLGNNDVGSGNVQPIVTGSPSSAPVSQDLAPSRGENIQQASRNVDTDDDPKGPAITKPSSTNTNKEINNNTSDQTVKATQPQLRRGAQMTSIRGSGNGGNTDIPGYNRPGSQGPGDGNGDKGMQNGNPNGTRYLGVRVISIPAQSFEDDFNENGKIALDIAVSSTGQLQSATYQVKGSTLPKSSRQYSIALQRAREIKYPSYEGGFKQTLTFNFSVK